MAGRRTLIVHAGGGKAGSSAIQSALGKSAGALAEHGISYAHASADLSTYEITSGNGFMLYERLGRPDWEERGEALVESYLADKPVGICSSEFLGSLPEQDWRKLINVADARGIDVRVVYFVRSAVGYITASYNQDVKRSGEQRTLDEFARSAGWQHLLDLRKLHGLFDADRLQVINYDVARQDIMSAMVRAAPELQEAEAALRANGNPTVNRSLTAAEIEVMRHINARLGQKYGPEVSDRLIYDQPELQGSISPNEDTIAILAGKFEDATSWVNVTFLNDPATALQFLPAMSEAKAKRPDKPDRALRIALDWAIEKIESASEDVSSLRDAFLAIDWHNSGHALIPHGFDPIAYLLINLDVLKARNPPYHHYIESGHREGRQYRWPLNLGESGDAAISDAIARLRLEDSTRADSPLWPRLRNALQLESLIQQFAHREREYLNEIRKIHEEHGFENERFRQRLGEAVQPVRATLEATRDELLQRDDYRARELERSFAALAQNLSTQILALKEDQAKLHASLEEKNTELTAVAGRLQTYRDSGFFSFIRWAVRRKGRP